MTSKKPGRKRKAGPREPSGRLSRKAGDKQAHRSVDEQSAMQVAKEARQRVFGVSEADSATELAGTVVGRLYLGKEINQSQLDAAKAFCETYRQYQRVMGSPRPPKAVEIGAANGRGNAVDISPDQHEKVLEKWDDAKKVLVDANNYYRGSILAACDYLALRDEFHPHMLGDFRVGMNALARHYGLLPVRAAAWHRPKDWPHSSMGVD